MIEGWREAALQRAVSNILYTRARARARMHAHTHIYKERDRKGERE